MVAAALDAAGLWLGDHLDGASFEDVQLAYAIERKVSLRRRPPRMARRPHLWRAAARGLDTIGIAASIEQRNDNHSRWGFKRPNVLSHLGPQGLSMFRDPHMILCLRDPVALAQRSVIADGVTIEEALKAAHRQVDRTMRAARRLQCPTLLVSFEKLKQDRDGFLDELFGFCGLKIERSTYPAILAKVERAGEKYNRIACAPTIGHLDKPLGWQLSGWCAPPGRLGPSAVDILADGIKLATAYADQHRPDLVIAGTRSPNRGFRVDLRQLGLRGFETIDVVLAGSTIRLHDSGYQLSALDAPRDRYA